ncbi:MAG: FAD/NAD(P)-binding protein [Deltaproteobacteria bacterium]|nr:FAD/NAD(P)-binding protein [Deltaproteobacteria bacterium]
MINKSNSESLYFPRPTKLIDVTALSEREILFRLRLEDGNALYHIPGQFVEVSILGTGEAPISIASSPTQGDAFELAIRAVGNVTQALHRLQPGDTIGIRGPFGNGFPVSELKDRDLLFIAGGIGFFPLRSMIQYVLDMRPLFGKIILLYGCRQPAEQLFHQELKEWRERDDVLIMDTVDRCPPETEWEGNVGVITTLFPGINILPARTTALVAGPPVMYRYVVAECLKKGIAKERIILSLERRMKCGIGLCGHCQIDNAYVCLDGPVFNYAKLEQLKEVEL